MTTEDYSELITANDGIMELYDILERLQGSRITPDEGSIMEKLDRVQDVLRRYSPLFDPAEDLINDDFWRVLTSKRTA